MGGVNVKPAMAELSKSDRGDESDSVKLSELLYGCHARGTHHDFFFSSISFAEHYIVVSSI